MCVCVCVCVCAYIPTHTHNARPLGRETDDLVRVAFVSKGLHSSQIGCCVEDVCLAEREDTHSWAGGRGRGRIREEVLKSLQTG